MIDVEFGPHGFDKFGVSKEHLVFFFGVLGNMYDKYFQVETRGVEHLPKTGPGMVIANHSGGLPMDAFMVLTSAILEMSPPRLFHGMVEKFLNQVPMGSLWSSRLGQFTGIPDHAIRLLHEGRLIMVFPEGARGTAKLYLERNSLTRFGTGFVRMALQTKSPIIPTAVLGGGDAIPTVMNSKKLGRLFQAPYFPVTPWVLPLPRPAKMEIEYGAPILFEGTGNEDDQTIGRMVEQVRETIASMIQKGLERRGKAGSGSAGMLIE